MKRWLIGLFVAGLAAVPLIGCSETEERDEPGVEEPQVDEPGAEERQT